jgi:hypothetical protein
VKNAAGPDQGVSIKVELLLGSDKEKPKDNPGGTISTVELKGEREFVILSVRQKLLLFAGCRL